MVVDGNIVATVISLMMNGVCCMYQVNEEENLRMAMREDIRKEWKRQQSLEREKTRLLERHLEQQRNAFYETLSYFCEAKDKQQCQQKEEEQLKLRQKTMPNENVEKEIEEMTVIRVESQLPRKLHQSQQPQPQPKDRQLPPHTPITTTTVPEIRKEITARRILV